MKRPKTWRTCYTDQVRVTANPGSRYKPEYRIHFEDNGTQTLIECGKIDVYAEIQSHRQSVDIHHLIDVYSRTGDASVFDRVSASYGDVSAIPHNYADLLNLRYKMEAEFAALPAGVRSEFDNDINRYVAQYGSDSWAAALGLTDRDRNIIDINDTVKVEVKDDA